MKKSLIALAVLAASGASFAQSSVTLYGVADVWFGQSKAEATLNGVSSSLSKTVLESGGVSSSRWGLKGSEDLGGGLKANFLLEQGFSLDTGAASDSTSAFSRYAYVGFSGGFGEVRLGKVGTAYDDIRGLNNNTFDSALTAAPWVGYTGTGKNELYYAMPAMGGLTGAVSYALGEDKTATQDAGSVLALNVLYAQGPFTVGFAHQKENSGSTSSLGVITALNKARADAGLTAVTLAGGSTARYNLLTGSYDFGVAKLLASYNKADFDFGAGSKPTAKEYQVGVDVPLSSNATLALGYGRSALSNDTSDISTSRAVSGAVAYSLSKRTTAYVGFNNTKVTFDAAVANAELKSTLYSVGVKHTF